MIFLIHENNRFLELLNSKFKPIKFTYQGSLSECICEISKMYPEELIIWSHVACKDYINKNALKEVFHHEAIMASYSLGPESFISRKIGYVDRSIFIKVNREVEYPTWLMSSDIGGCYAKVLNNAFSKINKDSNFEYFLNSIAKIGMPKGFFCYSAPSLLKNNKISISKKTISTNQLFAFIKQHYKISWVYYLFLCFLIFEKKFPIISFLNSFKYVRRKYRFNVGKLNINSSKNLVNEKEVDVIIPTLGRKKYLFDVLQDFKNQTILPKNVVIVEQNPDPNSKSDLDYLTNREWPFIIHHFFINQLGACNARNLALKHVTSEWVILGDDDNRFDENLISKFLESVEKYGVKAVCSVYLQPHEEQTYNITSQTTIFGSGNSIVKKDILKQVSFDLAYEFGYGEDRDFGMQIRNCGEDVMFDAGIKITHLKASSGGFRSELNQPWDSEVLKPKPSPTISLFNLKYLIDTQLLSYKLLLFVKYYKSQKIKNPIKYYKMFNKQWESSMKWANKLMKRHA